jgi:hypothetical protein
VHTPAPLEQAPPAQAVHAADELAATTRVYAPAAQAVHPDVPVDSAEYVPAVHAVHAPDEFAAAGVA